MPAVGFALFLSFSCTCFFPAVGKCSFHPLWVRSFVIHHVVLDLKLLCLVVDVISEGVGEQIVDAPASHSQPQILKEVVEVVKAVKNVPIAEIVHQKRIPERIVRQIDDVPVPQILNEIVEVVRDRISEEVGEQIDDDIVPVDQRGDQACCDTQACGDAEKGP